jgi:hypothetical protein
MNTKMRNSRVSDEWLTRICAENPIHAILGDNGQPNGNYFTGPVRLAWTQHLFTPRPATQEGAKGKYDCSILFPPGVDLSLLQRAALTMIETNFQRFKDGATGKYVGLEPIFHDQGMKANFEGYTPGGVYLNVSTNFKPQIVEPSRTGGKGIFNPVTDEARVYPGVWAVCAINPYSYGVSPPRPKKGVKFGIQGICIIQDDQSFGGAGVDPRTAFAGISVTADTNVAGMFGGGAPGQPIAGMAAPQHAMPVQGGVMSADQMRDLGLA